MEPEDIFHSEVDRLNLVVAREMMPIRSLMETGPAHRILSLHPGLRGPEAVEAAGLQIGRVVLGHDLGRSGLDERQNRRDRIAAARWLAKRVIPEAALLQAEREGQTARQLAEECGTTPLVAAVRLQDWMRARGKIVELVDLFSVPMGW